MIDLLILLLSFFFFFFFQAEDGIRDFCLSRGLGDVYKRQVEGKDFPEMNLFLQKRWEDKDGNIYAKRVGTVVVRYYTTTDDWRNNATYSIMYGDITGNPEYKAHMMRLQVQERYAVNSKGESVPIKEVAWGTEDDIPTHIQLQFTSSHGGAYIGSPGNSFYVDNVKLIY